MIVPQYTRLVIDAKLSDAATSSNSVIVVKLTSLPDKHLSISDEMKFYQPYSTIAYKIRIVNPALQIRTLRSCSSLDSSRKQK